ncbi:uncharacterized protein K452DRAFT_294238 [Aplosporella prunicola CBS 121167]|uniref:WLM domain-containing protein n=1 Tax=Aplosporella prunicola CBS 121167 TaxID=1176127 RepID=A0A6A6BRG6_9PEZI|nr:uncharacterized protein K452DRAFT_294238 [Aplosporella prunicola CBS 121167]KAF2146689.1 hypothetical protein K452DRAFT_294238 [Aplosporella prunicola CBS 121167]
MREIDPLFTEYEQIRGLPKEKEALEILRKIASLVKPIMRKRNWRVHTLCEFLPNDAALLGLNINHTQRICVRLRHTHDPKQFVHDDMIIDTLLHELSHVIWGDHDVRFNALWDELRSEYHALKAQGYSGEGFLSEGHQLGGKRVPLQEARRQARVAAEKRRTLQAGSGQRLGGAAARPDADIRQVIAAAAENRNKITKGCASGTRGAERMAEEARRLGFRTKAEMDDADQLAIAIALMEDEKEAEEKEMRELGAMQSEGLTWSPERGLEAQPPPQPPRPKKPSRSSTAPASHIPVAQGSQSRPTSTPRPGKPVSRLVAQRSSTTPSNQAGTELIDLTRSSPEPALPDTGHWTCEICTLVNETQHLCCDACGIERPSPPAPRATPRPAPQHPNRGSAPPPPPKPAARPAVRSLGWTCSRCGAFMEHSWWTCSACGTMKATS